MDEAGSAVRRRRNAGLLCVLTFLGSACASGRRNETAPTTVVDAPPFVSIQSGYASDENFCAVAPLTGTIRYRAEHGVATFELHVRGLPSRSLIGLDWINDSVRGYTVAAFTTDGTGKSEAGSLRMFRPGEVKAIDLHVATTDIAATVLGRLRPC